MREVPISRDNVEAGSSDQAVFEYNTDGSIVVTTTGGGETIYPISIRDCHVVSIVVRIEDKTVWSPSYATDWPIFQQVEGFRDQGQGPGSEVAVCGATFWPQEAFLPAVSISPADFASHVGFTFNVNKTFTGTNKLVMLQENLPQGPSKPVYYINVMVRG